MTNWLELSNFKGIDLTDSFVLNWKSIPNTLLFELEASIWPDSPHYDEPRTEEFTCYKSAYLVFSDFEEISGLKNIQDVQSVIDATGGKDYGNIDDLNQTEDGFSLHGEFGDVLIRGGVMKFEIVNDTKHGETR